MRKARRQMRNLMDAAVELGATWALDHDMETLEAFASQLRGFGHLVYMKDVLAVLDGVEVPKGFCHVNYTAFEVLATAPGGKRTLGAPKHVGCSIPIDCQQLDLDRLVRHGQVIADDTDATSMGPGDWVETIALPTVNPGMLELGMVIEPFEVNDGSDLERIKACRRRWEVQKALRVDRAPPPK